MRPIDANKLEGKVRENFKEKITRGVYAVDTVNCSVDICRMVEEQPTACDVEKVIEQLKEEGEQSYVDFGSYAEEQGMDSDYEDWFYRGLVRAIEIVKRGGRDEK